MKKKQSKADKAFIEKLKTLNIGGGKTLGAVSCPGCGDPLKHHVIKAVPIPSGFFTGLSGKPANN